MKRFSVLRFITGGTVGVLIYFLILYTFTDLLELWYIFSSIVAFICNVLVNFIIHRFWTFKGKERKASRQLIQYFIFMISYQGINLLLLYLIVEYLALYYLMSQLIITTVFFVPSFLITRKIFAKL